MPLNIPSIRYVPIHPLPDSIEGRPLATSAFFLAIFLMSVLRDTKRVVQHQGYLRLDIAILFDKLKDTMPTEVQSDPVKVKEWMQQITNEVIAAYEKLEPDDTYVHPDTIQINKPAGTVSADSLQAIDALFKCLERQAVRALKTMPLLLGTDASRSETQANREWEIYAKGIESVQHPVEYAFEDIVGMALQAQGHQVDVRARFEQFRAAEAMRDEQVDYLKAKRARFGYDCGYISQDEAAKIAFNKDKADQEEPRASATPDGLGASGGFGDTSQNPNPGEGRDKALDFARFRKLLAGDNRQPTFTEIDDAEKFLTKYGPDELNGMFDAEEVPEADTVQ